MAMALLLPSGGNTQVKDAANPDAGSLPSVLLSHNRARSTSNFLVIPSNGTARNVPIPDVRAGSAHDPAGCCPSSDHVHRGRVHQVLWFHARWQGQWRVFIAVQLPNVVLLLKVRILRPRAHRPKHESEGRVLWTRVPVELRQLQPRSVQALPRAALYTVKSGI